MCEDGSKINLNNFYKSMNESGYGKAPPDSEENKELKKAREKIIAARKKAQEVWK